MNRFILVATALLIATSAQAAEQAVAKITAPDGTALGTVSLTQGANGVLVSADLEGLPPGGHGFHIHETGACSPDFKAAGGHFNPTSAGHGVLSESGHHAGDLPNIFVTDAGSVRVDLFTTDVTLRRDEKNSLFDGDGSAIIVHEKADTYADSAGAGGRIGCGLIESLD